MAERTIAIVGAGAAGLMAAIHAAGEGRRVTLLERTKDGGRKILISGGGRCNVLPSQWRPEQYVTASSPNTMRNMLRSWPLAEQIRFFEERLDLPLALEAETGKLFPVSNRARDVRDRLVALARELGVLVRFDAYVTALDPADGDGWRIGLADGDVVRARSVVIATGGLSVPATGSDGTGLRLLARLGHTIHPLYPALTPLTAQPTVHAALAGVSLRVTLTAPLERGRSETAGGFLFTHRGYSGPAVLDISHHAVRHRLAGGRPADRPIFVRWTGEDEAAWDRTLREESGGTVASLLRRRLPTRLADVLLEDAAVPADRSLAELRRDERARLVDALANHPLPWTGDEGYRKAEVTGGGVALGEVDPRTLESRRAPGLFLCGELLDAFGPIGGYNFLWGWATGRAAGLGAVARG
jgi:predicted Rossmann fold flavoprotein